MPKNNNTAAQGSSNGGDGSELSQTKAQLEEALLKLQVLHEGVGLIKEASDFNQALESAIHLICKTVGWPVGHAYVPDEEQQQLNPAGIWYFEDEKSIGAFKEVTEKTSFKLGEGLPGRIWQSREPVWIVDVSKDDNFPRAKICKDIKMHGAVGFPVVVYENVVAVLEFFSYQSQPEDGKLLQIFQLLGEKMGQIHEKKEAEKKLRDLARHDALTLLPNRAYFQDELAKVVVKSARMHTMFAILYIDVDRFKQVNDTLDHGGGDAFLVAAAEKLKRLLRETDFIAHMGGDEFVILIEAVKSPHEVGRFADYLLASFREPTYVQGKEVNATVSIGIAIYPESGDTAEALMKSADRALYAVKEGGRNGSRFISKKQNEAHARVVALENHLRQALDEGELGYAYQPIVDVASHSIMGFEVLMRWCSEEYMSVAPKEFIPIAEDIQVLTPYTIWLMQESLKTLFDKLKDEEWMRVCKISFNVSVSFLSQQLSKTFVEKTLASTSLRPDQLVIELTETQLMKDVEKSIHVMEEVSSLGVAFAIDDFGVGYSSLNYLKRLPLDYLKIDKSFVDGCPDQANDVALTQATIQMAHALGLQVIAEGAESKEQVDFLASNACDFVQGYYYARPIAADNLCVFVRDWEQKYGKL